MEKLYYFAAIALSVCNLLGLTLSQTSLGSCDFKKYPSNGCEDELGAECDPNTSICKCKTGNWFVIDQKFCFPIMCPRGQYFDHNLERCETQRKATLNSEQNYCRYDFHCRGNNIHCQQNEWNNRCVCNRGFIYDTSTQECQKLKGLNGYCSSNTDCDENSQRQLVCVEHSCQCAQGFTYNNVIDGCEDNERIKERDSQMRTLICIFIVMGLLFGAVLSMKFSYSSPTTTRHLLLKRIVASHQQQTSSRSNTNQRTQNPINNRETA